MAYASLLYVCVIEARGVPERTGITRHRAPNPFVVATWNDHATLKTDYVRHDSSPQVSVQKV